MALDQNYILSEKQAAQLPPLTLAFVGDSVFDLYVRTRYALLSSKSAGQLHGMAVRMVNAAAQAAFAKSVLETLTDTEADIFRRGRNAKSASAPKNMSLADYHYATAIEAVIGYLYLTGQGERIKTLLSGLRFENE